MTRVVFGDVEEMLIEYLDSFGYVVTTTPGDLKVRLAANAFVIRVQRVGGGDEGHVDRPRVSVMVFALRSSDNPRAARNRADEIRAHMLNLPAVTAAGRLDKSETESGPVAFPWPDPEIAGYQCIYRLSTRR